MSNDTNRMWMNISGFNNTITFYPNTNKSFNIGPFKISHSHGSQKVLVEYVTGPETNGRTISCRDINGGLCPHTCVQKQLLELFCYYQVIAFLVVAEQNVGICELEEENMTIFPDQPINGSSFPPSEYISLILKATRTDLQA